MNPIQSEGQFHTLADALPQLIWIADNKGKLVYMNQNWRKYRTKGYACLLGDGWLSVLHEQDRAKVKVAWQSVIAGHSPYNLECRLATKDGEYRWHQTVAVPLVDENGNITKLVGYTTDIHEQRIATEQLRRAKQEAERASQLKSAFLANMSHEIRTPLGIMLGFADLIADSESTATDRVNYASIIKRNGELLTGLINDILDLSKVEAGFIQMERVSFCIQNLVDDLVTSLRVNAMEKGLTLLYEISGKVAVKVKSDPLRIRQILSNLIGNAIKFTDSGGVKLAVSQSGDDLYFEVIDTGIGIAAGVQKQIFDTFTQADQTITRRYGGTGLGLTLSRRLARLLGGDLVLVRSQIGKGSTFLAHVHVERAAEVEQVSSAKRSALPKIEGELSNINLLLIEDLLDNQMLLQSVLERKGALVDVASRGEEGLVKLHERSYDLILMDIEMPGLDGYSTARQIRAAGYQQPIVAVTAHAMTETREKCLEAGCTDYISKPVSFTELFAMIARYAPRDHNMKGRGAPVDQTSLH